MYKSNKIWILLILSDIVKTDIFILLIKEQCLNTLESI